MEVLLKLKRSKDIVADFSAWNFDDVAKGNVDRLLKELLEDRLHTIFGTDGVEAGIFLSFDEEEEQFYIRVDIDVNECDGFATGKIALFELLNSLVQYNGDKKSSSAMAKMLRELAKKCDKYAKDYRQ